MDLSGLYGRGRGVRTARLSVAAAGLCLLLAGCGGASGGSAPASASPSPAQSPSATGSAAAASSTGVTIRYGENAQVELSADGGARVLIDVWNPTTLSAPATQSDVLLTTHTHDDHVSFDFQEGFPGRQLFVEEGALTAPGVTIRGVAAAHSQGDALAPKGGTDYIFIVDMGGLRIAHFGDLGQNALTPAQLKALGHVDVAIGQLENSFSQMDVTNKKGFRLMRQVQPRLILQTHTSVAALKYAKTLWPLLYSDQPAVTITAEELPAKTSLLLMGEQVPYYTQMVPAEKVAW